MSSPAGVQDPAHSPDSAAPQPVKSETQQPLPPATVPLPWLLRPDLTWQAHESGGWILKDPLRATHVFLDAHEYLAARLLDGRLSLQQWQQTLQNRFPDHEIDAQELWTFLRRLIRQQLLLATVGGDSRRLLAVRDQQRRRRRWSAPLQLLRLRVPLMDPSRLLQRIEPWLAFVYTRTAAVIAALLVLSATALVTVRFDQFRQGLPDLATFAGRDNLLLVLLAFIVVKCCHEFAHALTCVHYGADCKECGVMMLTFTPVLYTNVSDSWSLKTSQRMAVTAAGIVLELVIAAVCVLLWWWAAPGQTRLLLLNTILLCSVTTVLFNGNPLLRFDGYFLLADYSAIPNLYQQASARVGQLARRYLFGLPEQTASIRSDRKVFLTVYGILAAVYRVVITFAILEIVETFAAEWQQEAAGRLLSWLILVTFLCLPLGMFLTATAMTAIRQQRWKSSVLRAVGGAVLLWLLLTWPWPYSVTAPCTFLPRGDAVYVTVPGEVLKFEPYGSKVSDGTVIAELTDPDMELRVQAVEAELRQHQIVLEALETVRTPDGSSNLSTAAEAIAEVRSRLESLRQQQQQLRLQAGTAGILLPPPRRPDQPSADQLAGWHGLPLSDRNPRAWLQRGTVVGYVGDPQQRRVVAYVDEDQIEFVTPGSRLTVAAESGSGFQLTTQISEISQESPQQIPPQITAAGWNNRDSSRNDVAPPVFRCAGIVTADDAKQLPALYSVGRVRIQGEPRSILQRVRRYLARTF